MRRTSTISARGGRSCRVVAGVATGLVLVLLALVGYGVLSGGWEIRPVLTGSMRPGLPVGGVVFVEREPVSALRVRDVIIVTVPHDHGFQIVHRVISITAAAGGPIIRTMGDANTAPDPWGPVQVKSPFVYQARFALPFVGYLALAAHSPVGRGITILIVGALVAWALASKARNRRRAAPPTAADPAASEGTPAPDAPESRSEDAPDLHSEDAPDGLGHRSPRLPQVRT